MRLQSVTLYNFSGAGNGTPVTLDWQNAEVQQRTVVTVLAAADTLDIEGTVDGTNWAKIATHNAAGTFIDTINGPWQQLRAVKTGALGQATVTGLV